MMKRQLELRREETAKLHRSVHMFYFSAHAHEESLIPGSATSWMSSSLSCGLLRRRCYMTHKLLVPVFYSWDID